MNDELVHHPHPWRAKLITGLIMLILAFIGLVIADLSQGGAWDYWRVMVPVFALLSLWLSWYLRKKKHSMTFVKIWHEIIHWLGLLLAVYMVSAFVNIGILTRVQASLMVITLLALTTFIAGIYIEPTFFLVGVMLGLFAAAAGFAEQYLYTIMLPITVIAAIALFFIVRNIKKVPSE